MFDGALFDGVRRVSLLRMSTDESGAEELTLVRVEPDEMPNVASRIDEPERYVPGTIVVDGVHTKFNSVTKFDLGDYMSVESIGECYIMNVQVDSGQRETTVEFIMVIDGA